MCPCMPSIVDFCSYLLCVRSVVLSFIKYQDFQLVITEPCVVCVCLGFIFLTVERYSPHSWFLFLGLVSVWFEGLYIEAVFETGDLRWFQKFSGCLRMLIINECGLNAHVGVFLKALQQNTLCGRIGIFSTHLSGIAKCIMGMTDFDIDKRDILLLLIFFRGGMASGMFHSCHRLLEDRESWHWYSWESFTVTEQTLLNFDGPSLLRRKRISEWGKDVLTLCIHAAGCCAALGVVLFHQVSGGSPPRWKSH